MIFLRAKPLRDSKFVVDVHLGKLVRKQRLLGFNTLYRNDFIASDIASDIVRLCVQQQRIILTRNQALLKNKAVSHGYWVRQSEPAAQLNEVVKQLQLENNFKPFSRCSHCNELL